MAAPGGRAVTEARIILTLVNGAVIFAAACLFVRFLCDEYVRALVSCGLLRPRVPADGTASPASPGLRSTRRGRTARP